MPISKKSALGGLAGLALLASAGAAMASPGEATASVNVRSGPGVNYRVVDTLEAGEPVDVQRCTGSWCYVVHPGPDGWVSANFLSAGGGEVYDSGPVYGPPVYYDEPVYAPPLFYGYGPRFDHRHHFHGRPGQPPHMPGHPWIPPQGGMPPHPFPGGMHHFPGGMHHPGGAGVFGHPNGMQVHPHFNGGACPPQVCAAGGHHRP